MGQPQSIVDISRADNIDLEYVGKKAFELGELKYLRIPIPEGFVITTTFFENFLKITGISKDLDKAKKTYHPSLVDSKNKLFHPVKEKILHTVLPQNLALEFHKFFKKLAGGLRQSSVNIFSSSKTDKSMIFLNILGDANVVLKIKKIWETNFESPVAIVITDNLKYEIKGKISTNNPVFDKKLTPKQKDKLMQYCRTIQNRFYFPKEIEFGIIDDKIFVSKINPYTGTISDNIKRKFTKGTSVNQGVATGPVRILNKHCVNAIIKKGEILIVPSLNVSLYRKIKGIKALVIDLKLSNSKEKAIYRKYFQIPTIEGTKNATNVFKNGDIVTVNGTIGEIYSGGLKY
jgi:phosphoenolpyruvate synthase/pyruvate phosphate dikinase